MFNGNCHQHSPSCLKGPITIQILIKHSCEISPTPKSQEESNKSLIMQHEIPQLMGFGWFERYTSQSVRAINFSIMDRERKQEAHKLVENWITKADDSIVKKSGRCTKHKKTGWKTFKTPLHQKVYILVRCYSELQRSLTIMPKYWIAFIQGQCGSKLLEQTQQWDFKLLCSEFHRV